MTPATMPRAALLRLYQSGEKAEREAARRELDRRKEIADREAIRAINPRAARFMDNFDETFRPARFRPYRGAGVPLVDFKSRAAGDGRD